MIPLPEMRQTLPMKLHDGVTSTTTQVWQTLGAANDGNLDRLIALAAVCPQLLTCQYNYTPPLHFAVREGHLDVAEYLIHEGALDPKYVTYPFNETLSTMAEDRGCTAIVDLLHRTLRSPELLHVRGDTGEIDFGMTEDQKRFQKAVNDNDLATVRGALENQSEFALNENAFWGEGILMMPAHDRNRPMLELLIRHGATVPPLSKWGREYYFKHFTIAAFLLDQGMSPNHMTWHRVTLLHDMAQEGDVARAQLLLDHGAEIDPIDEEYRSTPLGLAARWGQRPMVRLLLERGADRQKAGAEWALPIEWARRNGHRAIVADLSRSDVPPAGGWGNSH